MMWGNLFCFVVLLLTDRQPAQAVSRPNLHAGKGSSPPWPLTRNKQVWKLCGWMNLSVLQGGQERVGFGSDWKFIGWQRQPTNMFGFRIYDAFQWIYTPLGLCIIDKLRKIYTLFFSVHSCFLIICLCTTEVLCNPCSSPPVIKEDRVPLTHMW